jgi:hypothetical protein
MKTLPYIIIIGLLAYIFFSKPKESKDLYNIIDTTTTTAMDYDSSKAIVEELPELVKEEKTPEIEWRYREVDSASIMALVKFDTMKVLADFFTKRHYFTDTTINEVRLTDSLGVYMNRLSYFKRAIVNMRPIQVKTNHEIKVQPIPYNWFIGGGIQGNKNGLDVFGQVAHVKDRMLYTAQYGVMQQTIGVSAALGF